jgi:FkbM family methyltransferase
MKQFIQRGLKQFGFEIRQTGFNRDLMDFVADRAIDTVLDVGANVGQFAGSLRAKGYRGRIISFEPMFAAYEALAAKATADDNWEVKNLALGAKSERTTINVAASSVYSSILPLTDTAVQFDNATAVTRMETIEVRKLDDVCPDLSGNVMLKIDTQGYERQVLEGSQETLPMLKGILMELPIIHLYQSTWQFHEAVEFMAEAGFVPAQIHPVNYHPADGVSLVEVDCLFRPRDKRLD